MTSILQSRTAGRWMHWVLLLLVVVGLLTAGCSITTSDSSDDSNNGSGDTSGDDSGGGTGDDTGGDTGGDDGSGDDTPTLIGVSGDHVEITGVWHYCYYNDGDDDTREVQTFEGMTLTIENFTYTSTDGSCSEGEAADGGATVVTLTQGSDVTLAGWSDGSAITTAPNRQDGGGQLDDPPTATVWTAVGTDGDGNAISGTMARMVDDSYGDPSETLMYRDHGDPSETCDIGEDYAGCLHASDFLYPES